MRRHHTSLLPALLLALTGACACAGPTDAATMESPSMIPDLDLEALEWIEGEAELPWHDAARRADATREIAAFYEDERECTAMEEVAVRAEALSGEATFEDLDRARMRWVDVGWATTVEGRFVVVQSYMDCGGFGTTPRPRIVSIFEVDSFTDASTAVWVESYGVLRDEAANVVERVEVIDGVASASAISIEPPAPYTGEPADGRDE